MTDQKHSPTPWILRQVDCAIDDAAGESSCVISPTSRPCDLRHIVRCVNAHDALVACRKALLELAVAAEQLAKNPDDQVYMSVLIEFATKGAAALAAAEEK